MRIFLTMIAAAMAVVSAPAMAQTPYGPATTLQGQRSDWTTQPGLNGSIILRSPKYGVNATVYNVFRFADEKWIWDGKQLIPQFTLPTATQVDTSAAYRQGWNDALAAVAALRKP